METIWILIQLGYHYTAKAVLAGRLWFITIQTRHIKQWIANIQAELDKPTIIIEPCGKITFKPGA